MSNFCKPMISYYNNGKYMQVWAQTVYIYKFILGMVTHFNNKCTNTCLNILYQLQKN